MTNGEAIHFAECLKHNYTINFADMEVFCDMAIKALEQEPFINKPCISSGVCEHDKNKVLDKIRAEIHATAEMHEDGDYYLRDEWIDEIFDKYKQEVRKYETRILF